MQSGGSAPLTRSGSAAGSASGAGVAVPSRRDGRRDPTISPLVGEPLHSFPVAARQISITLEEDLVRFLDACGGSRCAAVAAALRDWRDRQWQSQLADAYAALAGEEGSTAASDPIEAAREAAALAEIQG